ncbi:hypothetical protein LB505_011232 [Fusarium chuoi]|nr:hypothetical protein LB505_011232 [Fusarium chuoi]
MPLQAPSERERRMYYHGLPSGPKLVARSSSSTTPWNLHREWPDRKRLYVATGHAIQQPWNDPQSSLQRLIIDALDRIDWTAIDILRIGYESYWEDYRRKPERPVTMLISVSTNSTTFPQAEAVIMACKDVLARFNLNDVEVEIKESIVSTSASSPISAHFDSTTGRKPPRLHPGPFDNDITDQKYDFLHDISEYTGTSISTPVRPDGLFKSGTKGVYLHGSNGKAYALTCRHVLFEPEDLEEYRYQDGNDTRDVLQPGENTLCGLVEDFKCKKATSDAIIELYSKPLYNTPENQPGLQAKLRMRSLLQSCEPYMNQFDNNVCPVLGRVEFSPRIELYSQQHKRLRDWALVEVAQDSFTTSLSELRNKIPVTLGLQLMVEHVPGDAIEMVNRLHFESSLDLAIGPVVIPQGELEGPSPNLCVMKHGGSTGFTIGLANGIHSVIRRISGVSTEWCIIGMNDEAFTATGDTGACVFDLKGRVGGMIASGLEAGKESPLGRHDVTYATPMQWLLEDIKRAGYDVKLPT